MDQLEALRQKILGDVVPLIIDGADSGSDKFSLILRLIQSGNADKAMYQKAYDSAAAIENSSERLEAMMALLDEIEIELDQPVEGEAEAEVESSQQNAEVEAPRSEDQGQEEHPQPIEQDHSQEQHDDQSNSN